ncbi:RING-type E3 ubiquitin transferase [Theileria orientalis]|uniref:RING-type E3 ubiquitin transferase n=1 Tax=Theileria orientalis TaxID=68886 RepID=A0A976M7D2_THEOR|nr:RING-type E3 ubiquitin transferase [Theileria orientalis]
MEILNTMSLDEINELNGALSHGLTLYEVLRAPRIANQSKYEGIDATLNGSGLREEISCPICSGIVIRCVVIKTCLHRFCLNCIQKCVRIGLHECPKCRKHVPSKRFLKADPIYDSIISRIVTNVEVFEKLSDAFTVAINKGLKKDPNIEMIRTNYLNEDPKINIKDLESQKFWIQNKLDMRACIKDFKKKRTRLRQILPKSNDYDKLLYKLISDKTLPQIVPNGVRNA